MEILINTDTNIGTAEMALLLTADPSEKSICSYLPQATILKLYQANELAGILVMGVWAGEAEIYNIAVAAAFQGKGLGQQLLAAAIEKARILGCQQIMIGTGNSSIGQLYLYQKMGFEITAIRHHYFTTHYPEPILENGIICKHMIRLQFTL